MMPRCISILTTCKGKGKGKGKAGHCYGATYMSQTRDQERFTISEVAADWHEPMVPQHIMWPSIACANGQLDPRGYVLSVQFMCFCMCFCVCDQDYCESNQPI